MSICRGCGAQIEWIKTTAGRNMPVDPEPVFVIEGEGRDRFVLDDGAVIAGRIARPEEGRPELPVAFVPHWKTCPNAGDFDGAGGGETVKRKFCLPCFPELKKAGKHEITRVGGGKNMKITCWRCKRRRYGAEYEISRKGNVK